MGKTEIESGIAKAAGILKTQYCRGLQDLLEGCCTMYKV